MKDMMAPRAATSASPGTGDINDLEMNDITDIDSRNEVDFNVDLGHEEPVCEPEPIFDPEAMVSTSGERRKKYMYIGMSLLAISAVVIGVSVSASNKPHDHKPIEIEVGGDNNVEEESIAPKSNPSVDDGSGQSGTFIDVRKGFNVNLTPFSENILSGYPSCIDLLTDVEEAGKYLANAVIKNKNKYEMQPMVMAASGGYGVDSYETNNQVEGVDEADFVKSDGSLVYAAYGNDIVVMNLEGEVLSRTTMPQVDYSFPVARHWNPEKVLEDEDEVGVTTSFKARSSVMPGYYSPTQSVSGMLLHNGRLVIVVSGYQYSSTLMFLDGGMTAALLYDIDEVTGSISFVDKKTIRGSFKEARSIENQAHIVTNTGINSYLLASYLRDWMFPQGLTDAEYATKAYARAQALIPQFAKQIVAELLGNTQDGSLNDSKCRQIVGLSLMRTGNSQDDLPDFTSGSGILNSFVQTTSFDMMASALALSESVSGAFLPSAATDLYVSEEAMIITGQGWANSDASSSTWQEHTFLMGFDVTGSAAVPKFLGRVPGYLLNQFSLDYYQGHLRVATTNSAKWGTVDGEWTMQQESNSQITVLKNIESELQVVGKVERLAPGERIYSVRFMQDKAAVVTFRQIDPFYTFDLSEPTAPKKVGELKIPGFSNYLHPIKDNKFILAVGQDADEETGRPLGLQVSLFDLTDFANPVQIQKTVIQGTASSSDAQYDHRAFRYIEEANILILPVSSYSPNLDSDNGFDGFHVYNVDIDNGIEKIAEVIHADSELISKSCFSWANLPPRSMMFQGSLMTFKAHSILMSDVLDTNTLMWSVNLDQDRTLADEAGCMPWFI